MSREVIKVIRKEQGKHLITYVLLDDGTEASVYGEAKVGDKMMVYFHEQWNMIKAERIKHALDSYSREYHNVNSDNIRQSFYKFQHMRSKLLNTTITFPEQISELIRWWRKKLSMGSLDYIKMKHLVSLTSLYVKRIYGEINTRTDIERIVKSFVVFTTLQEQTDLVSKNLEHLAKLGSEELPFVHGVEYKIKSKPDETFDIIQVGPRNYWTKPTTPVLNLSEEYDLNFPALPQKPVPVADCRLVQKSELVMGSVISPALPLRMDDELAVDDAHLYMRQEKQKSAQHRQRQKDKKKESGPKLS